MAKAILTSYYNNLSKWENYNYYHNITIAMYLSIHTTNNLQLCPNSNSRDTACIISVVDFSNSFNHFFMGRNVIAS